MTYANNGGSSKSGDTNLLDVAAKATSFNVILQVLIRVSSFVLNGFVLRYVKPDLLGVVNLRLTLLFHTILFLSREPLRKAALSRTSQERKWQLTFNLLWLALPMGVVSGSLLSLLWISPLLQQPDIPWDKAGVIIFFICALIELTSEPLWVLAQVHQHITVKVIAEGIPQILRCLTIAIGVVNFPEHGVLVFGCGQLVYSSLYACVYYGYFLYQTYGHHNLPIKSIFDIFPTPYKGKWQSAALLNLSWSFFKQSLLKQFLTDGERYIMTILGFLTFAEQGIYDIINNLGSLVARFLFLPIEESFYVFFAHTIIRGQLSLHQNKELVILSSRTLSLLLKLVVLVALIILVFGYSYSELALSIYGGKILSEGIGPLLLKWYCVYVLFLAVNGITECFMFAAMSEIQVNKYSRTMLVFSGVFLCAAVILIKTFGSIGFILANCVNMGIRIFHSCHYIHGYFTPVQLHPLARSIPSVKILVVLTVTFIITAVSEVTLCCNIGSHYQILHIIIGCGCLLIVGVVIITTEQRLCGLIIERLPVKIQKILSHFIPFTLSLKEHTKTD